MHPKVLWDCLSLLSGGVALVALFTSTAWAQEVLPFPPKASGSAAGRTMQEAIYSPSKAASNTPVGLACDRLSQLSAASDTVLGRSDAASVTVNAKDSFSGAREASQERSTSK
jgi:hypothetical protein